MKGLRARFFAVTLSAVLLAACGGSTAGGSGGSDGGTTGQDGAAGGDASARDIAADSGVEQDVGAPDVGALDGATAPDGSGLDVAVAVDTASPRDTGGPRPPCEPCGYADVRGRVCAPNEEVYVSGATVWVDAVDCNGQPLHVEAISDPRGYYLLEGVPCGPQTVRVQRGSYEHGFSINVTPGEVNDITGAGYKLCFTSRAARLAVITGDWDNIEDLVGQLGLDVDVFELYGGGFDDEDWTMGQAVDFLSDFGRMSEYDVIFVDCGEAHYDLAASTPIVDQNIRRFVEEGGSLYMSDFAYIYSERVWPQAIDFWGNNETAGTMGASDGPIVLTSANLTGIILDTDLKAYLGNPPSIPINLGLSPLVAVEGARGTTTMHVIAQIPQFDNVNQPLILSYQPTPTSGHVIYTTFHNTEQHMDQMQKVLQYLVFVL